MALSGFYFERLVVAALLRTACVTARGSHETSQEAVAAVLEGGKMGSKSRYSWK